MDFFYLALLGFFSGISSALFGIGGGTVIIPILLLMGYDMPYAVGISILQMIFASFFSSYLNYKKNLIDLKNGVVLGIGGLIGSSFSGAILTHLSAQSLHITFFLFTFLSFYKYFFSSSKHYIYQDSTPLKRSIILLLSGCIVGIFASSLGIGGGLLLTPLLGYFLGLNSKETVPLALFFICFSSTSGALSLYEAGFIHIQSGVIVGVFSMIGVIFGQKILSLISAQTHKLVLGGIYLASMGITLYKIFT
ncbi:sulfite exporter TauE/SafE family protein [Helicobacter cholecystus]|uniref:Probable membrane transporter protein n=1 Tax=Helicobacter cholecystus TaxID=45498 RepID=A0A3D8IXM4_9HELI|nr:sulfite exporter TauE/SafE family protein [Helicobacter cholecystus]RDU70017.1 sulfite exporter TauE/SafE family protein [Helicobacter cholecystus]VEJ24814.1 putative integral membrane protein [Helicobacter cholecystus]